LSAISAPASDGKQAPFASGELSLEEIFRAHFDFVYRAARQLGGPALDPDDVVQEVFTVVAKRLHTYDRQCQIRTWLYGIIINVARGMRRSNWLRRVIFEDPPAEACEAPTHDSLEVADARRIAAQILERMPAKKREVFILAELGDLSPDEIAAIVGIKTETVWSRLHYARKDFSARLARVRV
jgi:RNA polymerase sigma-70 factor (ECF subfamily)